MLQTAYYRYYTPGAANGYTGGLEYVFNPASYQRLTAALGTDLGNLTDAQVAPYADNYFQYDSQHRVTLETAQGGDSQTSDGLSTSTYSYTAGNNPVGFGNWAAKTVVTNKKEKGQRELCWKKKYKNLFLSLKCLTIEPPRSIYVRATPCAR